MRKVTTLAIAGFVVVGLLSLGGGSALADQNAAVQNATNQTANVTIQNQTSNGSVVMVNSTTLPQTGFLVAYNKTLSAPLGNSSSIQAGSQQNVSVMLDQPLTQNTTVLVAAFEDTNNNSQFDFGTDEVFMSNGQPVIQSAMVNVTGMNATTPTPTPTNATTPTPTPANATTPTPTPEEEPIENGDDEEENETLLN